MRKSYKSLACPKCLSSDIDIAVTYENEVEKEILYCVLTRIEIFELRHIIDKMDESAFVTILEVSEIIGEHIKSSNRIKNFFEESKG